MIRALIGYTSILTTTEQFFMSQTALDAHLAKWPHEYVISQSEVDVNDVRVDFISDVPFAIIKIVEADGGNIIWSVDGLYPPNQIIDITDGLDGLWSASWLPEGAWSVISGNLLPYNLLAAGRAWLAAQAERDTLNEEDITEDDLPYNDETDWSSTDFAPANGPKMPY